MGRGWVAIVVMLLAGSGRAEPADALNSDPCRQALATLQEQEDAAAASADPRARRARLNALRRDAARACLGGAVDLPGATQRSAQPPVSVTPVPVAPAIAPRVGAPAVMPLSRPAAAPRVVTGCDAGGCWASDGSHLDRAGPNLVGPSGLCRVEGNLLLCP